MATLRATELKQCPIWQLGTEKSREGQGLAQSDMAGVTEP